MNVSCGKLPNSKTWVVQRFWTSCTPLASHPSFGRVKLNLDGHELWNVMQCMVHCSLYLIFELGVCWYIGLTSCYIKNTVISKHGPKMLGGGRTADWQEISLQQCDCRARMHPGKPQRLLVYLALWMPYCSTMYVIVWCAMHFVNLITNCDIHNRTSDCKHTTMGKGWIDQEHLWFYQLASRALFRSFDISSSSSYL